MIINDKTPDFPAIIRVLDNGNTILYPTDTIYGLGCDALNLDAVNTVRDIKGREDGKPFLVLAGSIQSLEADFEIEAIKSSLTKLWPGPFTVLLKPKSDKLNHLLGPTGKIGVRIGKDEFLEGLFSAWDGLLVSTSANISGQSYNHDWHYLEKLFSGKISILIQREQYPVQAPSALLDWEAGRWKVLRPGAEQLPNNYEL